MIIFSFVVLLLVQLLPCSQGFARFTAEGVRPIRRDENGNAIEGRIMGGSLAAAGQFPFQTAVYASKHPTLPEIFCGGVLISSTAVLTAAHCVIGFTYFDVILGTLRPLQAGSAGRVQVKTTDVRIHQNYSASIWLDNDIALVIMPTPVSFDSNIQPILLPRRSDANLPFVQAATTSGWGKIGDVPGFVNEDLLYVNINIIDVGNCFSAYGPEYFTLNKVCITTFGGTKGPCHGDSGGPLSLIYKGERILVGLVSYGAKAGCESGFPDVYTRITSYLDWIASNGGPAVRP